MIATSPQNRKQTGNERRKNTLINYGKCLECSKDSSSTIYWGLEWPFRPFETKIGCFYLGFLAVYTKRARNMFVTSQHGKRVAGNQSEGVNTYSLQCVCFALELFILSPGIFFPIFSVTNPLITCAGFSHTEHLPVPVGQTEGTVFIFVFAC